MSLLHWIDNRTLLGCDLLIGAIYTIAFFVMKLYAPRLRGTGAVSSSYALVSAGCLLFIARGSIAPFLSIVVANALIFASSVFFLRGILRFFAIKKSIFSPVSLAIFAILLLTYFTVVHDNMGARVAIIGLTSFLLRGIIARELYRQASKTPIARLFSYTTGCYAVFGALRAISVFAVGSPTELMAFHPVMTLSLILDTSFIFSLGLFVLFMLSSELLSIAQDESLQDVLTGALNRRGIEAKLALELKRIDRSGHDLSVAFIDIDHFKSINDSCGHAGGDEALRQVSAMISSRLRAYDLLARYGGDEFLLVLPQTSWSDTLIVCERLEQVIRKICIDGTYLSISTGITQAVPGELAVSLLARADKALYVAKDTGRDHCRVVLHDPHRPSSGPTDSRPYITIPVRDGNADFSTSQESPSTHLVHH